MIGVIAGPSSMRVLNNKSYSSSTWFYYFIKNSIPIKNPNRDLRKVFDNLALLNLTRAKSSIYENSSDREIEGMMQEQIQIHENNEGVRKKSLCFYYGLWNQYLF
jgi:hypothetical protein